MQTRPVLTGEREITTVIRDSPRHHVAQVTSPGRVELPRLTGLRALAAGSVFLCHIQLQLKWHPAFLFREGYAGVSFFFMLSGFVLTWASPSSTEKRPFYQVAHGAMDFYRRRFARIWPVHIAVLGLMYYFFHQPAWLTSSLITTIFLVQAWIPTVTYSVGINGVAWSLSCEAAFYAFWPIVVRPVTSMAKKRSWLIVVVLYGVLLVATWDYYDFPQRFALLPYLFPPIRFVEFLAGMLLASAMQQGWRCRFPLSLSFLILLGVVCGLRASNWHVATFPGLLLDPILLLIIASAATLDMQARNGLLKSRLMQYAGKLSFAFYLVHISVIVQVAARFPQINLISWHGVLLIFAISLMTAMLLHHVVEVPCNRLLRPRHDKPLSV